MILHWLISKAAIAAILAIGGPAVHPTWEIGAGTVTVTSIQAARHIPAGTRAVIADIERWSFTPMYQQHHPLWAIRHICRLVHAQNAVCIAAPAADLFGGETGYLSHQLARSARYADILSIQDQTAELNVPAYQHWTRAAIRQARSVNPRIMVLGGLTTSDRIGHVTGWALLRAVKAAFAEGVRGFWLNIPKAGPGCPTCGPLNPGPAAWLIRSLNNG